MDLWTSMFTADFDEGEENSLGNDDNANADAEMDYNDEDNEDENSDGDEDGDRSNRKRCRTEPDDDAIFDFELEPIVSIAEPPNTSSVTDEAPATRTPRHSLRTAAAPPPPRPTTSQINATDENGVPINYELGVVYICPACGAEYRQQDMWKRHMNEKHHFNTRRGLNFIAVDKLYQRCLECNKRIAMHSRENLLKHKFTHLPFRCTKCYICKREYKYRQDLMVHLRMIHCDEVIAMMRDGDCLAGRKTRVRMPRTCMQENKFETDDGIEVKNEVLEPDINDEPNIGISNSMDDDQSRDSSLASGRRKRSSVSAAPGTGISTIGAAADICEDYIHYSCPDCGSECDTQAQWSQHIEFVHDYVSRRGLNFRSVDMQMQCIECSQFVQPNTIKTLRQHKFSHLPHREWLRCKLCYKGYTEHERLVAHLLQHHNLKTLLREESDIHDDIDDTMDEPMVDDMMADSKQWEDNARRVGRHSFDEIFERNIDYLCPQCGKEFKIKKQWRIHVVQAHGMNDLSKLNFEVINERQLKCTECDKIITNAYGIQNAQQHRITHLPYKAYARCRKCHKSYTDRKALVKHLATYHRVGFETHKRTVRPPSVTRQPRTQIVTVANETYEIIYLDDEESNEGNDFGEQMRADPEPIPIPMPRLDTIRINSSSSSSSSNNNKANQQSRQHAGSANRYKCVDCGSMFATQIALKTHISEEHDFLESQHSAKTFDKSMEPSKEQSAKRGESASNTIEQNYIFLCPSCGEEYKTQFDWRRHINVAHHFDRREHLNMRQVDKYRYQCTHCKDIVCNSKLKALQDHHFRHLPYRLYLKCLICGTCYNHKPNIAAHLRTRHNIFEREANERSDTRPLGRPNNEEDSAPSSASRSLKASAGALPIRPAGLNTLEDSISYHNAVDLDFITYYCPKCNKNFASHAFWRKHIVEEHNYNSRDGLNFRQLDNHHYLCLECYKRVTVTHTKGAIGQLQSHKFRHLPYRSFKCLTCNAEFVRKQMFFKHLNRVTNRCDNEPRSSTAVPDDDEAEEMENTHSGNRTLGGIATEDDVSGDIDPCTYQLLCPQCGDEFSTKSLWRKHLNIAHSLGKRECLHLKRLGDVLFQCEDCNEKLRTNKLRDLQQHRFKHLPHAAYIRCLRCEGSSKGSVRLHSMQQLQQHISEQHPAAVHDNTRIEVLHEEEGDDAVNDESSNGPYMPLPPHISDDTNDLDFDEQYLLG